MNLFMIKSLQVQVLILLLTRLMKMEFCYHEENVAAKVYLVQSTLSLYKSNQNQIKYIFSNSNFTKLINYIKLQRNFTQKRKKRTFQMLHNRKFQNLMSRSRAYNQLALAKLSGDALLG